MFSERTLKHLHVLCRELDQHGDESWALFQAKEGVIATARSRTQGLDAPPSVQGVVFSLRRGDRLFEGATARLDENGLTRTVQELIHHTQKIAGPFRAKGQKQAPAKTPLREDFAQPGKFSEVDPAALLQRATAQGERIGRLDKRIVERVVRLGVHETREVFVSTREIKTQHLLRSEHVVFLIFREGENNSEIYGGGSVAAADAQSITHALGKRLVKDGLALLGAERLRGGARRCILSPGVAGMLAHEAFGHGMEADMFVRGRGSGAHYLGEVMAGPLVGMVDSPALPGEAASFFFDHEGTPATHTHIVQHGVLNGPISDRLSALKLGITPSSNGRRENVFHKAYTRMTNTYFEPGPHSLAAMMKSLGDGLYIDYPTNGMEDPKGWGIQVEALMAREVKNGRFTGKVFSPVIITGYVPDILQSIEMVGDKLEIGGLGFCGKGHKEWVKVTDGGPHLLCTARVA